VNYTVLVVAVQVLSVKMVTQVKRVVLVVQHL
jgi:hypothetical protein